MCVEICSVFVRRHNVPTCAFCAHHIERKLSSSRRSGHENLGAEGKEESGHEKKKKGEYGTRMR